MNANSSELHPARGAQETIADPRDGSTRTKILFGWSGGKDSALALREVLKSGRYEIAALLTTCTEGYDRVSMHGVRCGLLDQQAAELGLPLRKVFIPQHSSNDEYETRMKAALAEYRDTGIGCVAFGDLYLEDIRQYRDRMLDSIGMKALYPIWGFNTRTLARRFVSDGFEATLVCVDPRALDGSFAGRKFDDVLLDELPPSVDPCGENGEFHTFVSNAPMFRNPMRCAPGEIVLRDGFYFSDLLPVS
jgi:uncharacterized protein (TIGR00290 family)